MGRIKNIMQEHVQEQEQEHEQEQEQEQEQEHQIPTRIEGTGSWLVPRTKSRSSSSDLLRWKHQERMNQVPGKVYSVQATGRQTDWTSSQMYSALQDHSQGRQAALVCCTFKANYSYLTNT